MENKPRTMEDKIIISRNKSINIFLVEHPEYIVLPLIKIIKMNSEEKKAKRSKVKEMDNNGLSLREIAVELGISHQTVSNWLKYD